MLGYGSGRSWHLNGATSTWPCAGSLRNARMAGTRHGAERRELTSPPDDAATDRRIEGCSPSSRRADLVSAGRVTDHPRSRHQGRASGSAHRRHRAWRAHPAAHVLFTAGDEGSARARVQELAGHADLSTTRDEVRFAASQLRRDNSRVRNESENQAGYGNRTRLAGLGSQSITTMLSPRKLRIVASSARPRKTPAPADRGRRTRFTTPSALPAGWPAVPPAESLPPTRRPR
jgi:hypothetical protein